MLVLTRKEEERVVADGPCEVVVLDSRRGRVRLGIVAGDDVKILRGELVEPEQEAA